MAVKIIIANGTDRWGAYSVTGYAADHAEPPSPPAPFSAFPITLRMEDRPSALFGEEDRAYGVGLLPQSCELRFKDDEGALRALIPDGVTENDYFFDIAYLDRDGAQKRVRMKPIQGAQEDSVAPEQFEGRSSVLALYCGLASLEDLQPAEARGLVLTTLANIVARTRSAQPGVSDDWTPAAGSDFPIQFYSSLWPEDHESRDPAALWLRDYLASDDEFGGSGGTVGDQLYEVCSGLGLRLYQPHDWTPAAELAEVLLATDGVMKVDRLFEPAQDARAGQERLPVLGAAATYDEPDIGTTEAETASAHDGTFTLHVLPDAADVTANFKCFQNGTDSSQFNIRLKGVLGNVQLWAYDAAGSPTLVYTDTGGNVGAAYFLHLVVKGSLLKYYRSGVLLFSYNHAPSAPDAYRDWSIGSNSDGEYTRVVFSPETHDADNALVPYVYPVQRGFFGTVAVEHAAGAFAASDVNTGPVWRLAPRALTGTEMVGHVLRRTPFGEASSAVTIPARSYALIDADTGRPEWYADPGGKRELRRLATILVEGHVQQELIANGRFTQRDPIDGSLEYWNDADGQHDPDALEEGQTLHQDFAEVTAEPGVRVRVAVDRYTYCSEVADGFCLWFTWGGVVLTLHGSDGNTYYGPDWSLEYQTMDVGLGETNEGFDRGEAATIADLPVGGILRLQLVGATNEIEDDGGTSTYDVPARFSRASAGFEDADGGVIVNLSVAVGDGSGDGQTAEIRTLGPVWKVDGGQFVPLPSWASVITGASYPSQSEAMAVERAWGQGVPLSSLTIETRGRYAPEALLTLAGGRPSPFDDAKTFLQATNALGFGTHSRLALVAVADAEANKAGFVLLGIGTGAVVSKHQVTPTQTKGNVKQAGKTQTDFLFEYMVPVVAEANEELTAATYEWSFGDGSGSPVAMGVLVHVPTGYTCSIVALGLSTNDPTGGATVEAVVNGSVLGVSDGVEVVTVGQNRNLDSSFTAYALVDGDYLNFHTRLVTKNSLPNQVVAWLRFLRTSSQ